MKATDRHKLIERINTLEGLTDDERSALLELLREHKTYGLVWEDKSEDVEERLRNELPVLVEAKDRALTDAGPDAPNHILIEGDNLEALATLAYTHAGKIDVIYIDPPYNTGNKDFIYNDSFVDSEDSYRHSKWLSFMSRRLRIAKKLLSDRGVIFVSIDDNEQANLKLLCDSAELFGEKNFVGTFFWKRTSTPPALSYKIRRKLEFVLCYQKSPIPQRTFAQGYVDGGDAPLLNSGNPRGILSFPVGTVHFNMPDGIYSNNSAYKIELLNDVEVVDGLNANEFRAVGNFKWSQANLEREVSEGTYFLIKSKQFSPRFQKATKATKVPSNIIDEEVNVGTNEDAQKEMLGFNLSSSFDYAKPSSLIAYLAKMPFWDDKDITVLDFFAGSGTTLHAVMQLNATDNGKRQCIICTNNESGICENITYLRNKAVIQGYTMPNNIEIAGIPNNNLRYYRMDFVGRSRSTKNMRRLVQLSTDMLCIKENLYAEMKTFAGLPTYKNIYRYFEHGEKKMLVIYDERYVDEIVKMIGSVETDSKIKVYMFSPSEDPWEASFEPISDKVELCALPQAIYNTYKRILPKRKQKPIEPTEEEDALAGGDDDENGGLFSQEGGDE